MQPRYTAQTILGIRGDDALLVAREPGFANAAIGSVGIVSLVAPGWASAAALAGTIFYGLAGVNHALHAPRNRLKNVAMTSDLFAAVVLLGYWRLGLLALKPDAPRAPRRGAEYGPNHLHPELA